VRVDRLARRFSVQEDDDVTGADVIRRAVEEFLERHEKDAPSFSCSYK